MAHRHICLYLRRLCPRGITESREIFDLNVWLVRMSGLHRESRGKLPAGGGFGNVWLVRKSPSCTASPAESCLRGTEAQGGDSPEVCEVCRRSWLRFLVGSSSTSPPRLVHRLIGEYLFSLERIIKNKSILQSQCRLAPSIFLASHVCHRFYSGPRQSRKTMCR